MYIYYKSKTQRVLFLAAYLPNKIFFKKSRQFYPVNKSICRNVFLFLEPYFFLHYVSILVWINEANIMNCEKKNTNMPNVLSNKELD